MEEVVRIAVFTGTPGDDVWSGTEQDDVAHDGNGGSDVFATLGGNDTIKVTSSSTSFSTGYDNVDLGSGDGDRLVIDYRALTENTHGFRMDTAVDGSGTASGSLTILADYSAWWRKTLDFAGVERFEVYGSALGDHIVTGSGDDTLAGGGGNDLLDSGKGRANADGGLGSDRWLADLSDLSVQITVDLTVAPSKTQQTGVGYLRSVEALTLATGSSRDEIITHASGAFWNTLSTGGANDAVTVFSAATKDATGYNNVDLGEGGHDLLIIDYRALTENTHGFRMNTAVDGSGTASGSLTILADYSDWWRKTLDFAGVERFEVHGSALGDHIVTGNGNDTLSGEGGDDLLDSGKGRAVIDGGNGNDRWLADLSDFSSAITVNLNLAPSTVQRTGAGNLCAVEALTLTTGSGNDDISTHGSGAFSDTLWTGDGNDTVAVFSAAAKDATGYDNIDLGSGDGDRLVIDYRALTENTHGFRMDTAVDGSGTASGSLTILADYSAWWRKTLDFAGVERFEVYGSALGDHVVTGSGDDTLAGGGGGDWMDGGAGWDVLSYLTATSGIWVSEGRGWLGDSAGDQFTSIEVIIGSNHDDIIEGQINTPELTGADGNDTLIGTASDEDFLLGGSGDDNLRGRDGGDLLDGGFGSDTADYSDQVSTGLIQVSPRPDDLTFEGITVSLREYWTNTGYAAGDTYNSIENIRGSRYADVLEGDDDNNILYGNGGFDDLYGFGGSDVLEASDPDRLGGGFGQDPDPDDDFIDGGDGIDTVSYHEAVVGLIGIVASLADQSLNTEDAEGDFYFSIENLRGTRAGDQLYGNEGDNWLEGGAGADLLDGAGGSDTADYTHAAATNTVTGAGLSFRMKDLDSYTLPTSATGSQGDADGDTFVSIENLAGSAFNDLLFGNSFNNVLWGGGGNDRLSGGKGADTLLGGTGDDRFFVHSASDLVVEATGGGKDTVVARASFALAEGQEIESLTAQTTSQARVLVGNEFDQTIRGSAGGDRIAGGGGKDRLYGGAGADTFVFDAPLGSGNWDRVMDFSASEDRIELDADAFADLSPGQLDAASFFVIGSTVARGAQGQIIYDPNSWELVFDADGVGPAGGVLFAVLTSRPVGLSHQDFIVV